MKNICRNWSLKEYPYINFAPDDVINNTLAEGSFLQKIISKAKVDYVEA